MKTNHLIRLAKAIMTGFFGLYVLFVAFGNVTDYNSNYQFVKHVLSMDTTFEGNSLMYRALTSPAIHHTGYILIIAAEWFIAIACLYGAWKMMKHLKAEADTFHESKKWGLIGLISAIAVWFLGFQVIGGEWFAMWQSQAWNGLEPAFRLTTYISTTILALMLKDN